MSTNKDIMKKLLREKTFIYKKYKKEIEKGIIKIFDGSPDEFIIQYIIIKSFAKKNLKNVM